MEKIESASYGPEDTRGKEKREEVYAEQFKQGYIFQTNSPLDRVETDVKRYKTEGLDVLVVNRAFGRDGREYSNLKAILVRKRE